MIENSKGKTPQDYLLEVNESLYVHVVTYPLTTDNDHAVVSRVMDIMKRCGWKRLNEDMEITIPIGKLQTSAQMTVIYECVRNFDHPSVLDFVSMNYLDTQKARIEKVQHVDSSLVVEECD